MDRARSLHLIFWIGFSGLIYQMFSLRVLFMFFVESTHAAALAISAFLGGLAASSLVFSRLSRGHRRSVALIGGMMLAAAAYGYGVLLHYEWIPLALDTVRDTLGDGVLAAIVRYGVVWMYLFLPAFFLGGCFPLVNGLYLDSLDESARETGVVYAWDTFGAIAGALIAGFVLLPELGLRMTALAAITINLLIALVLIRRRPLAYTVALVLIALFAAEMLRYISHDELRFEVTPTGKIQHEAKPDERFGKILFQEESPFGRVTVGDQGGHRSLYINYRTMCNPGSPSEENMAQHTMDVLPPESSALNIGLGCGLTAGRLARHPHTKQLDIVEINPIVAQAARLFESKNGHVLDRENVSLHILNGADWLRQQKRTYDAVLIDIEEVSVIYSSPLYTQEYFRIVRDRLKPGGVFTLWSFRVSDTFTKVMVNTLASVFPHVAFEDDGGATVYYASMEPLRIPITNRASMEQVLALPITEINRLDHRALEKHYNSNQNFGLPDYYREKFVREAPTN